jgi:1,4-alpha-glucan branching enzyme
MKKNKIKTNNNGQPHATRIRFEFTAPEAQSVLIAGTFNDWRPAATPMVALGEGRWVKDLALPPGEYEYCLVVDGQWKPDPLATKTVENPFGGVNSICRVNHGN